MIQFKTISEEQTAKIAAQIASVAKAGDTFALFGTLGAGKSVFCRSFVQSLTGAEEVPSPTFTLVQGYLAKDFEIFHFDLYRLKTPEEIFELGMEDALAEGVCLIEWPEKMGNYLPKNIFKVEIEIVEGDKRLITISSKDSDKEKRLKRYEQ